MAIHENALGHERDRATAAPTQMTLLQRWPSNRPGKLCAGTALVALALAGLWALPALALSRTEVALPGGNGRNIVIAPDLCLPQPQVLSFTAAAATVAFGASTTLSWTAQVPSGCNYILVLDGHIVGLQGSVFVTPIADTSYKLTLAWGPSRTLWTSANTTVAVTLPEDPAEPTRKKVTITAPPSLPLFLQALRTDDTSVVIDNAVELDLSGLDGIPIHQGVRLIGGRTAVPGKPYQPGPRLYTTTRPSRLLVIQGSNVRISGLRIQGRLRLDPPEIASDDHDSSIGISISPTSRGLSPIEIDHNEIFGWSAAAVEVLGNIDQPPVQMWFYPTPSLITYGADPEPADIHDNYIHHNLHEGKMGYGVVVGGNGSHALIERNVFDWNRHAISGDGSNSSGYRAYRNFVLAGGGYDSWIWGIPGIPGFWHFTHQFDMHGQKSYCLTGFADRDCGTAGHDIDIRYNAFLYTAGTAIKIRGTPQFQPYGAVIASNVFAHDSVHDAVDWTENGVWLANDNRAGVTSDATDSCDFDGDGIPDRFLTTGQTWWFSSAKGQGPWVYLNSSTLKLKDVKLGYFDDDNLCDVSAGGIIYSGGTALSKSKPLRPRSLALSTRGLQLIQ